MSLGRQRFSAQGLIAKLIIAQSILVSCGQDPAFTETQVAAPVTSTSAKPTSADGTANGGQVGTTAADGSAADGSAAGGSAAGGVTTTPPYVAPANYPPGTPQSNVLTEDGGTLSIPGTKALKVGVNFEDYTDFDFNDSVLCFNGDFKVSGSKVTSYKKQTINAAVLTNSDCGHNIRVRVIESNGVVSQNFVYNDTTTHAATLNFNVGSVLDVTMYSFANSICVPTVAIADPSRVIVAANQCRQ